MKKNLAFAALALLVAGGLSPEAAAGQCSRQIGGVGITVFRDENFRGRSATFRRDVPDLDAYEMNDRISSLTVAPGEYWEGCEHPKYGGRCVVFSGEERDLRPVGWSDKISSLRRVRRGRPGSPSRPQDRDGLILYDEPSFRGRSLSVDRAVGDLRDHGFSDSAESVRVLWGAWELCVDENYRDCRTVDRDVADLSAIGMRKRASSVRPLGGTGRPGGYEPPWGDRSPRLVLYDETGYRGSSYTVESAEDRIPFSGRAESLRVIGGRWEVCDGASGRGRCEVFSADEPDLSRYGLRNRIVSVRPVSGFDSRR
ncbi:MAG: beta/gamma crystallin-related protein [Thermoanaerobaculia bacterium]